VEELHGQTVRIGAAVVIVGALFKIQHWPLADFFLIIGLTTEAIIFIFSAFEPPHEDPDWSLVYPELATRPSTQRATTSRRRTSVPSPSSWTTCWKSAKIEPELIESLGMGMRSLSDQAKQMGEITGAAAATSEYAVKPEGCLQPR
jgi:gliding motility-associated protein GldL